MKLTFDRGTVVLEGAPPGVAAGRLPGTLWDPRVGRYRAPGASYPALRAALRELDVDVDDRVPDPITPAGVWTAPPLRPYQQAALTAWEAAGRRGTIVLPTGSGKTRVAIAVMARLGVPAICLVPTRVLVEQWCRELAAHYTGNVGRFGDGVRVAAGITVSTYASAERHMHRLGNRFELVVVDEVHHIASGGYDDVLAMATAPLSLGLTATPPRGDDALARLSALVGPIVYELAVGDLAGRFLAPFDLVSLTLPLSSGERQIYDCEMEVFRRVYRRFRAGTTADAGWSDFVCSANRSEDGRRALGAWRRAKRLLAYTEAKRAALADLLARHRDARVLVFTAGNESAYAIARQHLIMPITCDIKRRERDAALQRFRDGQLRALVSARVLNEGLDVPDADVAVVVGGSHGEREHVQRIGRLLRPGDGKRAVVYELVSRATSEVMQAKRRRASLAPRVAAQL